MWRGLKPFSLRVVLHTFLIYFTKIVNQGCKSSKVWLLNQVHHTRWESPYYMPGTDFQFTRLYLGFFIYLLLVQVKPFGNLSTNFYGYFDLVLIIKKCEVLCFWSIYTFITEELWWKFHSFLAFSKIHEGIKCLALHTFKRSVFGTSWEVCWHEFSVHTIMLSLNEFYFLYMYLHFYFHFCWNYSQMLKVVQYLSDS